MGFVEHDRVALIKTLLRTPLCEQKFVEMIVADEFPNEISVSQRES